MAVLTTTYGTATSITLTTTGLTSDTNLLAGRQSTVIDNTSDIAIDAIVGGTIDTNTGSAGTITSNTVIEVWVFGSNDGTNYTGSGQPGASDANWSIASAGAKRTLKLATTIDMSDATKRSYGVAFSVAQLFGGAMPEHWGIFIVHNTGLTQLGTTTLKYRTVKYTST
jgi:hypothetical protein